MYRELDQGGVAQRIRDGNGMTKPTFKMQPEDLAKVSAAFDAASDALMEVLPLPKSLTACFLMCAGHRMLSGLAPHQTRSLLTALVDGINATDGVQMDAQARVQHAMNDIAAIEQAMSEPRR